MGFSLPSSDVVGSNPASPSLGFLGGLLCSKEVPEGWWGSWVSQRATESLQDNHSATRLTRIQGLMSIPLREYW